MTPLGLLQQSFLSEYHNWRIEENHRRKPGHDSHCKHRHLLSQAFSWCPSTIYYLPSILCTICQFHSDARDALEHFKWKSMSVFRQFNRALQIKIWHPWNVSEDSILLQEEKQEAANINISPLRGTAGTQKGLGLTQLSYNEIKHFFNGPALLCKFHVINSKQFPWLHL